MVEAGSLDMVRVALLTALKIAAPILGAGILVGLIVSIFQSVTSIQDQTLTFVPKIVVMVLVAALLLPWIAVMLMDFAVSIFTLV